MLEYIRRSLDRICKWETILLAILPLHLQNFKSGEIIGIGVES